MGVFDSYRVEIALKEQNPPAKISIEGKQYAVNNKVKRVVNNLQQRILPQFQFATIAESIVFSRGKNTFNQLFFINLTHYASL
ncbi:hypothetical protein MCW_01274 [Cardidatus Bartonella washoeensis 085-0475]|uniref:Uncharacterized protein n=1 Tax=Cardidatus Bartonella washoeensis 085-0475 TaxID=1094564 RepID=J1JHS4_9HYPH|nr:hypothetical protein MCW_01274 [Bartonella washoeensis 085-0475]